MAILKDLIVQGSSRHIGTSYFGYMYGFLTGYVDGDISGNAETASRWQTPRTFTIGNQSIIVDGARDITFTISTMGLQPAITLSGSQNTNGYMVSLGNNQNVIIPKPTTTSTYGVIKTAAASSKDKASLGVQTTALPGKYYGVVTTTDGFAYVNVNHPWKADGPYAASLYDCEANGQYSVAEGNTTTAFGDASHAEGIWSESWGDYSHAEGLYTTTTNTGEHAEGTYNASHLGSTLHSIGIGTDNDERRNAIEVTNNGNMYLYGIGEYNGTSLNDAQSLQEYLDEFNETTAAALCDLSDRIDNINPDMPWVYGSGNGANNAARLKYGGSFATGQYSVAEGMGAMASGVASHAEGWGSEASGDNSHAEGMRAGALGAVSHAEGVETTASGDYSHGEGWQNTASGLGAHVEGYRALAQGEFSHAEGTLTNAMAYAHAEGRSTTGGGFASHAEGSHSYAKGAYSHAEGQRSTAFGYISHAGGFNTLAYGDFSITFGSNTLAYDYALAIGKQTLAYTYAIASGFQTTAYDYSVAEGYQSMAFSYFSHAEGAQTFALGSYSHTEGKYNTASGDYSHAEGNNTRASGDYSHAEGKGTIASGDTSHAEGGGIASGSIAHAEGNGTIASGNFSHAEGDTTTSSGLGSHAEGSNTIASGIYSHAEGTSTKTSGDCSHAEGSNTIASGIYSHAEGIYMLAYGKGSHAEGAGMIIAPPIVAMSGSSLEYTVSAANAAKLRIGYFLNYGISYARVTDISGTTISLDSTLGTLSSASVKVLHGTSVGQYSHAEGLYATASGNYSHAEGSRTTTYGNASHAEGYNSYTVGAVSHAEGEFTQTTNRAEHAEGRYNKSNKASVDFGDAGNTIHSVGIGTGINARKNAFEIMQNGNAYLIGVGNYDGTNINGSTTYTLQKCVDLWEPGTGEHSIQQKYSGAKATGNYSIAIGRNNAVSLPYSFISGNSNAATFNNSNSTNLHIEGASNTIHDGTSEKSVDSHIEGGNNTIWGCIKSHIEGYKNTIYNEPTYTHIEGEQNIISAGRSSHIEGMGNSAGNQSILNGSFCIHVEGRNNTIIQGANYAKVSGIQNVVQSLCSNTEGFNNFNNGSYSHAEGFKTNTRADYSHTEGRGASFNNDSDLLIYLTADPETAYSAANIQGGGTIFYKKFRNNDASNKCKIRKTYDLEVGDVLTLKYYDTTEALNTPSTNYGAIGFNNFARIIDIEPFPGNSSFVYMTLENNSFTYTASSRSGSTIPQSNWQSHFESIIPKAATITKPAIFCDGVTIGAYSHSEGNMTRAIGYFSHSEGSYTKAFNEAEHAQGAYNKSHWTNEAFGSANNTLFSIGCGTSSTDRKNAIEVMQNGDVYVKGVGNYEGTSIENADTLQDVVNAGGGGGGNAGNSKVFYGTCDTVAATVAKDVDCDDFTSADLVEGVMVIVKFSVKNTGDVADLTLNVEGTGAKGIRKIYYTSGVTTLSNAAELAANATIPFIYNGTYWVVAGLDYNTNTDTVGYQLRTNSMSLPMTSITYRYRLLFTSADGKHFVPANNSTSTNATASRTVCQDTIDPFGPIIYYGTTASVAAGSRPSTSYLWRQNIIVLGYSFNRTGAALTLTSWEPVYIKCAPQASGGAKIDATTPYVQTLPSTEDGMIYILLGIAYDATHVELTMNHPVYYYSNGKIRIWTGVETIESIPSSGYGQVKSIEVCQTPGNNPNTLYIVL